MDVHRHEGARQARSRRARFARFLHVGVDRQLQVVAGHRRFGDAAGRPGSAGRRRRPGSGSAPARRAGTRRRCPRPRPCRSRRRARGRGSAASFSSSSVDLADVAERCGRRASRAGSGGRRPARPATPGKAVLVLFEVVDEVVADVAAQGHRRARGDRFALRAIVRRTWRSEHVGELGELRQLGPALAAGRSAVSRVDLEREAGAVGDQHVAVAVEDLAARAR